MIGDFFNNWQFFSFKDSGECIIISKKKNQERNHFMVV